MYVIVCNILHTTSFTILSTILNAAPLEALKSSAVEFTEAQSFNVLYMCTDHAGDLHLGAGTNHFKSGGSEGGVSSKSFSQSNSHPIRSGPDHVVSLFPGGESQRYDVKKKTHRGYKTLLEKIK